LSLEIIYDNIIEAVVSRALFDEPKKLWCSKTSGEGCLNGDNSMEARSFENSKRRDIIVQVEIVVFQ
jgi:hypothetical protein